jgi:hypothetical protein
LFYDAVDISICTASNGSMAVNNEWEKILDGSICRIIEILSQNFPEGAEKNYKKHLKSPLCDFN